MHDSPPLAITLARAYLWRIHSTLGPPFLFHRTRHLCHSFIAFPPYGAGKPDTPYPQLPKSCPLTTISQWFFWPIPTILRCGMRCGHSNLIARAIHLCRLPIFLCPDKIDGPRVPFLPQFSHVSISTLGKHGFFPPLLHRPLAPLPLPLSSSHPAPAFLPLYPAAEPKNELALGSIGKNKWPKHSWL